MQTHTVAGSGQIHEQDSCLQMSGGVHWLHSEQCTKSNVWGLWLCFVFVCLENKCTVADEVEMKCIYLCLAAARQ